MFAKQLSHLCIFYCISPLHAGTGQATGAIDLPIQRERHTGWPQVQASGVKGAFRHWFQSHYEAKGADCYDRGIQAEKLTNRIFGSDETGEDSSGQAGAVSFSDARLLAFPVRSNVAPFVWVTCPSSLIRLERDLNLAGIDLLIPRLTPSETDAYISISGTYKSDIVLEDLAVSCDQNTGQEKIKELEEAVRSLAPQLTRFLLISDQNFSFLVRTATEIQPQIKIDMASGTASDGSLRYQELLPADSVLYSVVFFNSERIPHDPTSGNDALPSEMIRKCVTEAVSTHIQMGGDATLGRGLMEVNWIPELFQDGGEQ